MNAKILIDLSDIHCGSTLGLMPPRFETNAGNWVTHGNNLHQIWLWEKWQEFWREADAIINGEPFVLLLNGDMTEGVHHGTTEIVAAKKREHWQIAHAVLEPITKRAAATLFVAGTECHTNDMEDDLAKVLKGHELKAKDKWLFEINGCLCDAAHHTGVTSRAYLEATAFSVTMGNAVLNQVRSEHRSAKVFLRGHRHCGGVFTDGAHMAVVTPGWQFLTRHGWKVVPDSVPRPGGVILDWRNVRHGKLPVSHQIFFNPPQDEIATF
jgi:hypothetical protein